MSAAAVSRGVLTLGEAVGVLRTRGIGSLAHESDLVVGTGGAEGNVAIGLARLGTPVTWLGRVGDDGLGARVLRELRAEGVTVVASIDPGAPTGLLLKETPAAGRTVVTYHRAGSAGSRLSPADIERVDIEAYDLLHVTGITPALSETARATIDTAVDRARAAGVPVSFDVNHRTLLWRDAGAASVVYRSIARRADVVFAGAGEAALVAGMSETTDVVPADLARAIAAELGPTEVVVKLGDAGAIALCDGELAERAAVPVTVVDTVGAGDAFVAGYLAARLAGEPVGGRLDLAVRTGAAACTHPGDWEGSPTRRELDREVGTDPVRR